MFNGVEIVLPSYSALIAIFIFIQYRSPTRDLMTTFILVAYSLLECLIKLPINILLI